MGVEKEYQPPYYRREMGGGQRAADDRRERLDVRLYVGLAGRV